MQLSACSAALFEVWPSFNAFNAFSQILIDHTGVLEDVRAPHLVHEKAGSNVLNLKLWYDSENSRIYEKLCHLIFLTYFLSILLYWIRDLFPSKYCCHIRHICRICVQTPENQNAMSQILIFAPVRGKVHKKTRWCFQVTYTRDLKVLPEIKAQHLSQQEQLSAYTKSKVWVLLQSLTYHSRS